MPFVDEAKIFLEAGSGGNGCSSKYWDRRLRHPKPDGGCGGKGGDVIISSDNKLHTLLDFRYNRHFRAAKGGNGGSQKKQGKVGEDCIIMVPVGTIVKEMPTGTIIRDLKENAQQVIVARGGFGGKGSAFSKITTTGTPGESRDIFLELRLISDAGIIGFPNAGKSTLISKISNATPKVASYPFTTKDPVLGIVEIGDYSISIADLPGIIEGAHDGRGLGFRFLRHALRTRFLIHLIDISATDARDPVSDYQVLNKELKFYDSRLAAKPQVVVVNKMDLPGAEENLERFKKEIGKKVYSISALTGDGTKELLKAIIKTYEKTITH